MTSQVGYGFDSRLVIRESANLPTVTTKQSTTRIVVVSDER